MQRLFYVALVALVVALASAPAQAADVAAQEVLEQLKSLAGTWHGTPEGEGKEAEAEAAAAAAVTHEFRVSAAGTVVMETMNPGTDHEMINMYHVDGEDLVLTHYCAGGNQPTMRLDRQKSTVNDLVFDFSGGTNLDAAVDQHIHSAHIKLLDGDHVESVWTAHAGGEQVGVMSFHLARTQ